MSNYPPTPFRRLRAVILAAMMAACMSGAIAQQSWQEQGYNAQASKIGEQVKADKLTVYEGNRQMIAVAKSYFPNDALLIGIWEDLAELAKSHLDGGLSKERFNELVAMRWDIFNEANRGRHLAQAEQQAQQRRGAFMQNFLTSMSSSMQRNNPVPITCSSTAIPGQVATTCR